MTTYLDDNPTCEEQLWLDTDQDWPSGPLCGQPAEWFNCNVQDQPVCTKHKCRHNWRIEWRSFLPRDQVRYLWAGQEYSGVVYECSKDRDLIEIYLTSKGSGLIRCRLSDLIACGLQRV